LEETAILICAVQGDCFHIFIQKGCTGKFEVGTTFICATKIYTATLWICSHWGCCGVVTVCLYTRYPLCL